MISGIRGLKSDLSPPLSILLWRLCAMNTSVANISATAQTGFVEKKVDLLWIPQPLSRSCFQSRSSNISPLVHETTFLAMHKHGVCGHAGRWTLISGQHLSSYCLLKLGEDCAVTVLLPLNKPFHFGALCRAFCFAFGFLLTLILLWEVLSPF